ncbi:M16 family metallopeptidase [Chitinophaga sp. Hz27]|uniref:M16 family metallopeptidase n=1 Tax=Chitinophaga sp. Hz27 TaxID=3347169 RepID=UPI0035DE3E8A
MRYRYWTSTGLLCLSMMAGYAQKVDQHSIIPVDTALHTGQLPNGFTYYIRKNTVPAKRVIFYLVNKVGSILEDDDQQGLAHFMEHMNFNGTRHFPQNELVDYLQKAGVRFGADLNATTSFDETVYQLPIPTSDPKMVSRGLDIMRDWAQEALLETDAIDKERGVIIEEKRLRIGLGERIQQKTFPLIVNNSKYASRSPIGIDSILLHFPAATIRRFFHDWYRPNLQAIIVVGDIDVNQVEQQIRKQFADLKNPPNERPRPDYAIGLTGKNQFLQVTDPEIGGTGLELSIKHRVNKMNTTTDYLNMVKRSLFNQLLVTRIGELIQQPNPPFLDVNAGIKSLMNGLEQFSFSVSSKPGKLKEAFSIGWSEVEKVKRFGFTSTELERAKVAYLQGLEKTAREIDKMPSSNFVNEYMAMFLKGSPSPGFNWEYNFLKTVVPDITLEDLKEVANKYITNTNRDIFVIGNENDKNTLPDSSVIETWFNSVASSSMEKYKDNVTDQVLLNHLPVPGKVISQKKYSTLGIQQFTLSNGVNVWMKPTTYKNDVVQMMSFAPGGYNKYSNEEYPTAASASGIIAGSGVADLSPLQLSKVLNGKSASVNAFISGKSQGIGGASSLKDLETALQLVYLRYTAPRKDTILFENAMAQSREQIINHYKDPGNVFKDTVGAVISGYDYRSSPGTLARLDSISLEKAYDIYRDRFADASQANFVFVGNFDVDSIKPLLEQYLGALPSLNRKEKSVVIHKQIPEGKLERKVYTGKDNKATVLLVYHGDCQYSPENKVQLQALSDILQYRLLTSLRENAGEVYTPSVKANMVKEPDTRFAINVSFGCAPEHVDHLIGLVEEDIKNLQQKGATADEVQKFKVGFQKQYELQIESNEFWMQFIAGQIENKEGLKELPNIEKQLGKVNGASIKAASKNYLSGKNLMHFIALPEKN